MVTIIATSITTAGMILVALIGAISNSDKAVARAVAPKDKEIQRLREKVISLGGDPDEQ